MVRTTISSEFVVEIMTRRIDGSNLLKRFATPIASDAFDYQAQAIGHFRFAIQESDIQQIDIEMIHNGECVEMTEITRD